MNQMNILKQETYVYFCRKRFSKQSCKLITTKIFYTHLFSLLRL